MLLGLREYCKKAALIICINDYPDKQNRLQGTLNDGRDMQNVLREIYGFKEIRFLENEEATICNILMQIQSLSRYDMSCIFYSGHGSRIFFSGSEGTKYAECLVAYDHAPGHILYDFDLKVRLASLKKVYAIFDCCHAAGLTRKLKSGARVKAIASPAARFSQQQYTEKSKIVELAACDSTESALETLIGNEVRGLYTYHLCRSLEEKNDRSLEELEQELQRRIEEQTPKINPKMGRIFK